MVLDGLDGGFSCSWMVSKALAGFKVERLAVFSGNMVGR
jgi:hypothetical protein